MFSVWTYIYVRLGECRILASSIRSEPWAKRLTIPNYPVGDAARYARVTPATIRSWQRLRAGRAAVADRSPGAELSYLQLIEVAVVSACRQAGMTLNAIREARDYLSRQFKAEHPFTVHQFATDGKHLLWQGEWTEAPESRHWLNANASGQAAWDEIINRTLKTFEYDHDLAVRWHVGGEGSNVLIDPRIAFGAPHVRGRPTWIFKERWESGEPLDSIADDFEIPVAEVREALQFERVDTTIARPHVWLN